MMKIPVSLMFGLVCLNSLSMQTESRGAKRVLFPHYMQIDSGTSPSKGFGTEKDVESPGTPLDYKKTKTSLGIQKVAFSNTTFFPVLLTYQGSAGSSSKLLAPFNNPQKNLTIFNAEIVLTKPLYISTGKGMFRVTLNNEKKRIELAHPVLYSADMPDGFAIRSDIEYQPDMRLKIRIDENLAAKLSDPIVQLSY